MNTSSTPRYVRWAQAFIRTVGYIVLALVAIRVVVSAVMGAWKNALLGLVYLVALSALYLGPTLYLRAVRKQEQERESGAP